VSGQKGYITVGMFADGRPGEVFIRMAKEGSTVGGLMDTVGILTSMALQHGVPLESLAPKLANTRFEPCGHTTNPELRQASSLSDYIFRWLHATFSNASHNKDDAANDSADGVTGNQ
jgi:ribonucleoside-diphosphate reductase alpha chain